MEPIVVTARRPRQSATKIYQNSRATVSGAVDELTFGGADRVLSAGEAVFGHGQGGFVKRYKAAVARRQAEDAADSSQYGAARAAGQAAGFIGSFLVPGFGEAQAAKLLVRAPRVAKAITAANSVMRLAPMPRKGLVAMGAVGGAVAGEVGQVFNDVVNGHVGSLGDHLGAIGGGVIGGVVNTLPGPTRGVLEVSRDVLSVTPVRLCRPLKASARKRCRRRSTDESCRCET